MTDYQKNINNQLHQYKVRFIKKRLLEGVIVFITTSLLVYLTIIGLEAIGRFNSYVRILFLLLFLLPSIILLFLRVIKPIRQLIKSEKAVTDEEAANNIGQYFPSIGDKLLNYIQLSSKSFTDNHLAEASINQRAHELNGVSFTKAVSYNAEKQHFVRYLLPLLFILIILISLFPSGFMGSTRRIIHFNQTFVPVAPFKFNIPANLVAFRNENYLLKVSLSGDVIPQEAFFKSKGKKIKMVNAGVGVFELSFSNLTSNKVFTIEAASYHSPEYELVVVDRPSLSRLTVTLDYPAYLHMPKESLQNIGSFEVPEGTTVNWQIQAQFTKQVNVFFASDSIKTSTEKDGVFNFKKTILQNQPYKIVLNNAYGQQQGTIGYEVRVIKDQTPKIDVKMLADTLLYRYVAIAGNITDDHGLRALDLHYTYNNTNKGAFDLDIEKGTTTQSVFYQWLLDTLDMKPGDNLQFYLQVTDNDAVNDYKKIKSKLFYLHIPDKKDAREKLANSKTNTREQINDTASEAKKLKENIDKLVNDLKGKKELSWQEEQMLENLVEQKENLSKKIEKLQEDNKMLNEQQKKFDQPSESILKKQEQLQELVDNLMDEETKQLYDELQKLLESYEETERVQDVLQKIQNKEVNLEQELERALEFFKQIQYETKLEDAAQDLDQLIKEQEDLINKTSDKKQPKDSLVEDQGKLNEKFNDFEETLRDARELNQDLKNPNSMDNTSREEKEVNEAQNQAKEELQKNSRNKSKSSQKNASDKMKQIGEKIDNMQSSMQMQQMQEDLGDLQAILNNLIELSFDQEKLMDEFKAINQSDPTFIALSQEQLALKEDSKIVNDSLLSLASRVMAISSFITRELNEMNQHMDASIEAIRERKKSDAAVSQQLTMTSVNNLALMLDNVMRQMQENMASSMGKGQPKDGDEQVPGLSEMQKQLNEQIQQLSQSGKSGRQLSEELAKLAAEQERIRNALEEAEKKYGGNEGEMNKTMQQMEQTEVDLVNKNLSRQTLQRQQQILTRMLEAEKSMRERELDTKREAKSATQYEKMLPKAFEEYIKQRQKEIELLQTVPPQLMPFFKKEVSEYFQRLKQDTESLNN